MLVCAMDAQMLYLYLLHWFVCVSVSVAEQPFRDGKMFSARLLGLLL